MFQARSQSTRTSALLVRGEDSYKYYHREARLSESESHVARASHEAAYRHYMAATIEKSA